MTTKATTRPFYIASFKITSPCWSRWFYKGNNEPILPALLVVKGSLSWPIFVSEACPFFHAMMHMMTLWQLSPPFGWFFLLLLFIYGATAGTRPTLIQNGGLAGTGLS